MNTYRVMLTNQGPEEVEIAKGLTIEAAVEMGRELQGDGVILDEETGEPADLQALGFEL